MRQLASKARVTIGHYLAGYYTSRENMMSNPFEAPESDALRRTKTEKHPGLEQQLKRASEAQREGMQGIEASPGGKSLESRIKGASDAKTLQDGGTVPGNLDLPSEAQPASASTERGATRRAEAGPEMPEVKNFDAETRKPKPPEGWHPGGPERG
jgi:hypothetical protein